MSLNQRVTAEFSTCTPSAPPTADLSIQTNQELARICSTLRRFTGLMFRGRLKPLLDECIAPLSPAEIRPIGP